MRLSCTICYELFISTDDVHAAPCGHILHHNCWAEWLQRTGSCPDCRKPINFDQLCKLFFNIEDGDDYITLTNKYDALRCDLSCKTKDYEEVEEKLKLQIEENTKLNQEIQNLKMEIEQLKTSSARAPIEGGSAIARSGMAIFYEDSSTEEEDAEEAVTSNKNSTSNKLKGLGTILEKLRLRAEEFEKRATEPVDDNMKKYTEADVKIMKECESIVNKLKLCLNEYEEMKRNSEFVKSLNVYTNQVDSTLNLYDDVKIDSNKFVELFIDVKRHLERKNKIEEELSRCPRGYTIEISGFPKNNDYTWRDIRNFFKFVSDTAPFITFNPGDEVAFVRFDESLVEGRRPAHRLVRQFENVTFGNLKLNWRALEGDEEIKFLKQSLEARDRRNRERFRKRKGYADGDEQVQETLLDVCMRKVDELEMEETNLMSRLISLIQSMESTLNLGQYFF